ncbi:MAG: ClpXP protease specificity-enhancing factor SspB [Ghiorsea sp.]
MKINFSDALKAKKIRAFFAEHGRVYIVVDATSDDVMVPDFLKGDPALRLVLNNRMPQQIHIRDSFIESNFSFSGEPYACVIPMACIWSTYLPGGDMSTGLVWEEDVPEVVQTVMDAVRELKDEPALTVVSEETDDKPSQELADSSPSSEGRKVGHLRVIK